MAGTVNADFPQSSGSTVVFYSLLLPAILLWFVYWRLSRRRMYELADKLPGPTGLPLIGNALDLTGSSHSKWPHDPKFRGLAQQTRFSATDRLIQLRFCFLSSLNLIRLSA